MASRSGETIDEGDAEDANREVARAVRAGFRRVATELSPALDAAHVSGLGALRALTSFDAGAGPAAEWSPQAEPAWRALAQSARNGRTALASVVSVALSLEEKCGARPTTEFGEVFIGARAELKSTATRPSPLDIFMLLGQLARAHEDDLVAKEVMIADLHGGAVGAETMAAFTAFWSARVYIPPELSSAQLQAVAAL